MAYPNYEEQYRQRFNIPPPPTPNTGVTGGAPAAPQAAPPPPAPAPTPQRPQAPQAAPPPPPTQPAGLMDFNTWYNAARQEAASKGENWSANPDAESRGAYEAYKYGAANPGQGGGMATNLSQEQSYAKSGDPTGMRAHARANGMSEDFDRFSNATLMSWESQKDSNCPPNRPYRSYRDNTCVEKPIDSNTGGFGDSAGQGGGGGGKGGGGGAPAAPAAGGGLNPATAGGGDMTEMLKFWKDMVTGAGQAGPSRYTPEAMAALEADAFSRARAQEKLQLEQSRADMAQRGVARSANQNAAVRQIGVGTGQQIMANRADIMKRKIDADFQDKQAAINNAQNWVNSMRDYLLRGDANAIQREQIAAQMRLAQMNINAQKQQLQQQYQNQLGLMEQSYQNNLSSNFILGGGGF